MPCPMVSNKYAIHCCLIAKIVAVLIDSGKKYAAETAALPLNFCVIAGNPFHLFVPQFPPHLFLFLSSLMDTEDVISMGTLPLCLPDVWQKLSQKHFLCKC